MKAKEELFKLINEDPLVVEYQKLENIVNSDNNLKKAVGELFDMQQQIVQLKYIDKLQMAEKLENDYRVKRALIETNPVIHNYLILQDEVNELLKSIKEIIEDGLQIEK
ncbi:MAG: YlbF family regulator [Acholeplasmataceae bacterium]|nr:YlbF family regulator [Acholeplasmataceae bacterium]MDD4823837.1 YlbF family regulator [Acholeplasmataceae bacterium]